jgi:hypothetical protein
MKDKIKTGLIIVLIVMIGLFGLFGGKAVKKYVKEIDGLKYEKTALQVQNTLLSDNIKYEKAKNEKHQKTIDSCKIAFKQKDQVISGLTQDLNEALAKLNGISSDSSYIFLQKVAYNYPGVLKYLFNELQLKGIHGDYLKARNADKIIPVYKEQIANCAVQLSEKDGITTGLNNIIASKDQQLANCTKINQDNDKIIKDTEKQRDKEKRRKNFWRFTTAVTTTTAVILAVFGI